MSTDSEELKSTLSAAFTSTLIRFALILFVVAICVWTFAPFMPIMLWAIILAVALYPAQLFLKRKLGWSDGRVATLIVVLGLIGIGVPTFMVGNAFVTKILGTYSEYEAGTLVVPEPAPSVADWPVVGAKLHEAWTAAAADLPAFLETQQPQLRSLLSWLVDTTTGTARMVFQMIGALMIAGILLAWAEAGTRSIRMIFVSLSDRALGPELHELTTKTVRQVAVGIIGIAFITAVIFGAVAALGGVPFAPLFTIIALLLAIMQVPVTLVALVAAGLLWAGDTSVVHNSIFSVLLIVASLTDNFLKPVVLGRGLDVPMPVVLIGALGGMMSGGILGMFIGAAFLSAGYQVFMKWVATRNEEAGMEEGEAALQEVE